MSRSITSVHTTSGIRMRIAHRRTLRGIQAKSFAELGIPCFGYTPKQLVARMETVLSGGDLKAFVDAAR
jgi:hypothetical protein